ncbi:alpha/beta hydrolase [Caulobacter mirabilis]|uniref:Alpha/beta hydrolase n=1 Tax=Caulobacter mirabilis TaxID=69666 RepID=A0A2D2AXI4_9CAUL|nr:alpha/beta fold hydrolase [Caulobacter mirabilis]ATQ42734.1 alpha/beta hydrolase [Caulobacter mirabilis]
MAGRRRVSFWSNGAECIGYVYGEGVGPCLVMAHGFGGTQEGSLARNAADFAAGGLTVLTFDYRGFGESGGEPRQVVDLSAQRQDWQAAIAFARGLPAVDPDRVALWGSSLGGGHVLAVAAEDPRLAAVVAQVPFNGFPKAVEGRDRAETWRLLRAALADWIGSRLGRPPIYVKAVGEPGELAVMATREAARTVALMDNPTWRNQVTPRALLDMLVYRPGRRARRLAMPVLLSLAERDRETPAELARPIALRAPFGELRRYPCTHFQFYDEAVRPTVFGDQLSFLRAHLLGFPGLAH